jgi:hypothetical protein
LVLRFTIITLFIIFFGSPSLFAAHVELSRDDINELQGLPDEELRKVLPDAKILKLRELPEDPNLRMQAWLRLSLSESNLQHLKLLQMQSQMAKALDEIADFDPSKSIEKWNRASPDPRYEQQLNRLRLLFIEVIAMNDSRAFGLLLDMLAEKIPGDKRISAIAELIFEWRRNSSNCLFYTLYVNAGLSETLAGPTSAIDTEGSQAPVALINYGPLLARLTVMGVRIRDDKFNTRLHAGLSLLIRGGRVTSANGTIFKALGILTARIPQSVSSDGLSHSTLTHPLLPRASNVISRQDFFAYCRLERVRAIEAYEKAVVSRPLSPLPPSSSAGNGSPKISSSAPPIP